MQAVNIPAELLGRPQWVAWRYDLRDGRTWTKVPCYHHNGATEVFSVSSTNPRTWMPFEVAYAVYRFRGLDGVGFVLSSEDPYSAADLDHISEWPAVTRSLLAKIIASGFYVERTPSGDGLRVWTHSCLTPGVRHKKRIGPRAALEVYDRARFLTVTGAVVTARTVLS